MKESSSVCLCVQLKREAQLVVRGAWGTFGGKGHWDLKSKSINLDEERSVEQL